MRGLNVRGDFASLIVSGDKPVETRRYKPPEDWLGDRIGIIKTGSGKAMVIGSAILRGWFLYRDIDQWCQERSVHHVPADSVFDWDGTGDRYGWRFEDPVMFDEPYPAPKKRGILYAKRC